MSAPSFLTYHTVPTSLKKERFKFAFYFDPATSHMHGVGLFTDFFPAFPPAKNRPASAIMNRTISAQTRSWGRYCGIARLFRFWPRKNKATSDFELKNMPVNTRRG